MNHVPHKLFQKRRLNFITIHCKLYALGASVGDCCILILLLDLYILSMTIIGSILLYPAGGLDYIDALFFASGCATQSGLNT